MGVKGYIGEVEGGGLEKEKEVVLEEGVIRGKVIVKGVLGKEREMGRVVGRMREGMKEMERVVGIE